LVREVVVRNRYAEFEILFDDKLRQLVEMVATYTREEHEQHGFYLRKQVWDLLLSSAFMARTNLKPRGYAGDSEMMRMLYEQAPIGATIFARFLHLHPVRSHAAQAVRNRIALLGQKIRECIEVRGEGAKVLSVACGPARELRHALGTIPLIQAVDLTLLDQDDHALAEAASEIQLMYNRSGYRPKVRYEKESVRRMLASNDLDQRIGGQNLIYSMGLFDYLTTTVARAVLAKLYELLAPGGQLLIGNYHTGNRTRIYMEYWMDWVLFYRTEGEFLALSEGLPGAKADVFFEETKSQMFLRVEKNV
jgi:extracellular factor (EF) 3-hydroxypalmitic acid methyl ester biosynthesis protein